MKTRLLVEELLKKAIIKHASDLFFLPQERKYQLSMRLASGLKLVESLAYEKGQELINYLKYAAQMDISEHRRPQVGAITYSFKGQECYLRLSSIGDFEDRESLVVRLIYQIQASNYFFPSQLDQLKEIALRRGLIVTSGPTGSGKTTTMYEIAREMGQGKVVMTIEDPVEVHMKSFFQAQVNNEAGISYSSLLKAALRHRPDILIIGEIRDRGTAHLAVDAALSGHLVLATVHAKSTFQTISRLEGLGIQKTELQNSLTAISYQRLLPTKQGLSCLLDLAYGLRLSKNIKQDVRPDFNAWRENLARLKKERRIDEGCYELYQEG